MTELQIEVSPQHDLQVEESIIIRSLHGISHGFFGRKGGCSSAPYNSLNCALATNDEPDDVEQNRLRVAAYFGLGPAKLLTLRQVHGTSVHIATGPLEAEERPEADAIVTKKPGLAIGVLTADCVPVLLADATSGVIGAVHAGWKSALHGILPETLNAMEKLGASRKHIIAAIGPAIGPSSYIVDAAYRAIWQGKARESEPFFRTLPQANGKYSFDLPGYVAAKCKELGIKSHVIESDTCADEEHYFSYRRSRLAGEAEFGRQISVICLKEQA